MAGELILIIEDDAHIGGLVVQVLHEAGYLPSLVPDIDAARLRSAEGFRPHAVMSDLMVSGVGEPARVAPTLGQLFPNVPVTLMTGVPPKRRAFLGVTHDRILEKPFELEALLEAVEAMLRQRARP